MPLSEILGWISRNGLAAFLIGCFLTSMAAIIARFLIGVARSITGHYPPYHETGPCYCCRESGCQEGCCCHQVEIEEEDEGEEEDGE